MTEKPKQPQMIDILQPLVQKVAELDARWQEPQEEIAKLYEVIAILTDKIQELKLEFIKHIKGE